MRRHIPSHTMLLSFEAVARLGSMARAAEDLSLSHSAVSRSVKNLEDFLGVDLLVRHKQRVNLTELGRSYANVVTGILEQLERETAILVSRSQDDPILQLAIYPTFGARWLMPRLPDFTRRNEDVQLNFTTGVTPFNLHSGDIDVAIQHGHGDWSQCTAVKILEEHLVAIVAPSISGGQSDRPRDVYGHMLLSLGTRANDWQLWFRENGLDMPTGQTGPVFETFGLLLGAVRAGLGAAVVPSLYVEDDIRKGRLVAAFGPPVASHAAFYAVCNRARSEDPKIKRFMDWIADQSKAPRNRDAQ